MSFLVNFDAFSDYIKNSDICDALLFNASLVKILDLIWGSNLWKTTINRLKMVASGVLKVCKKKSKNGIEWNLPGLCSFMRPYNWHKIWGLNCRASEILWILIALRLFGHYFWYYIWHLLKGTLLQIWKSPHMFKFI